MKRSGIFLLMTLLMLNCKNKKCVDDLCNRTVSEMSDNFKGKLEIRFNNTFSESDAEVHLVINQDELEFPRDINIRVVTTPVLLDTILSNNELNCAARDCDDDPDLEIFNLDPTTVTERGQFVLSERDSLIFTFSNVISNIQGDVRIIDYVFYGVEN